MVVVAPPQRLLAGAPWLLGESAALVVGAGGAVQQASRCALMLRAIAAGMHGLGGVCGVCTGGRGKNAPRTASILLCGLRASRGCVAEGCRRLGAGLALCSLRGACGVLWRGRGRGASTPWARSGAGAAGARAGAAGARAGAAGARAGAAGARAGPAGARAGAAGARAGAGAGVWRGSAGDEAAGEGRRAREGGCRSWGQLVPGHAGCAGYAPGCAPP